MYRQYTKRHENRLLRQRKLEILGVLHLKSSNNSSLSLVNETHNSHHIDSNISTHSSYSQELQQNFTFNDEENVIGSDLKKDLVSWSLEYQIKHNALSKLLKILNFHKCTESPLPEDARSFLNTPRTVLLKTVDPGSYVHFGISNSVSKILGSRSSIPATIFLNVNFDGLPLTKSTNSQLWPILINIHNVDDSHFIAGVYHGCSKPLSVNQYLEDFVQEMKTLFKNGILIKNNAYDIKIRSFVCDAPARAYITCTKGHNAYFGCGKCCQEGVYLENRVIFPETNSKLRTDTDFLNQVEEDHHRSTSILTELGVGMVTHFPLDYMHLVCLGVMKKLLKLWLKGSLKFRWQMKKVELVSKRLLSIKKYIPKEFCRKPRSLLEVDRWKASEFRQFLLYSGPIVLQDVLPDSYYNHFLCLHSALTILASETLTKKFANYANSLLIYFVEKFSILYGKKEISYNIHNLIHLTNDVNHFGIVDSFSAFSFENYMQRIKKLIRKSEKPLQQILNRTYELDYKKNIIPTESYPKMMYSVAVKHSAPNLYDVHKKIIFKNFCIITNSLADRCVRLKNGLFVFVECIGYCNNEKVIAGKVFKKTENFYDIPLKSLFLGISLLDQLTDDNNVWPVSDISGKVFTVPISPDKYIAFPLLH
ncbi:hypothetical protein RN001_010093 [Aquatica leii]|uniref:Transposase domain-containing protein n=1 Tax=Aquatica leii TaxID=1421715 RepID=A0AAN7P630_9COLE|nr:hypothetical protein RN001_010093 [Aquatica leii]